MDDDQFASLIEQVFRPDHWFYTTVAGARHRNADGTLRARIIRECGEADVLAIIPEPENPYDSNAQRIVRIDTGEQLGYVEAAAAAEIARDLKRGYRFAAVLKHHNFHPDTGRVVGAVIALVRYLSTEEMG